MDQQMFLLLLVSPIKEICNNSNKLFEFVALITSQEPEKKKNDESAVYVT